jgi:hypothetical protein
MALQSQTGSIFIATDTGGDANGNYSQGKGIYSKDGGWRINTTDPGPGLYAADGAYRGVISASEASPPPGKGIYTPDGALRLTRSPSTNNSNSPGVYALDGSLKVTLTNI